MIDDERGSTGADSMWPWWPLFIGGFCGPLLAPVLVTWVPPYVAIGSAFFAMWIVVGLLFTVLPPSRNWSFVRWAGGGAVGALIAGAVAFVLHSH
jgi:hypothetical protein